MKQQPDALRLAEIVEKQALAWIEGTPPYIERIETSAELRRLHNIELAYKVWQDKTEWVQETARPHELGMHRADVLRQRLQERKWVELTNEEISELFEDGLGFESPKVIYREIKDKLKEKNT